MNTVVESDANVGEQVEEQNDSLIARNFFIAAVKVIYLRDSKPRERTVNVLLDLAVPYITKATLNDIIRAATGRVMQENQVEGDNVREAIVMNISPMGFMSQETFRSEGIPSVTTNEVDTGKAIQ